MGQTTSTSPISDGPEHALGSRKATCEECNVTCCGQLYGTFITSDKKVWVIYQRAASRTTRTTETSVNITKDGLGMCVGQTETTNVGDCLIKMLRNTPNTTSEEVMIQNFVRLGCTPTGHCVNCFAGRHPELFRSIALSVKGRAWLVNSDTPCCNTTSCGDVQSW